MVTTHQVSPDLARSVGLPEDRFPLTKDEADYVDEILSKELEKLSVQEHESILFDVHGISVVAEEDAEMLETKLQEMQDHLQVLDGNEAYLETLALDPVYAAEYRLMYLRGENYNAQSAAEKLAQRFEAKKEYFGGGAILAREIRWTDLTETAQKVVMSGYLIASTVRDSSGRAVIFSTSQYERNSTVRDMEQAIYYYTSLTLRDEDTLRSGLVWVFYNLDNILVSKDYMASLYRVQKTVPPRLLAIHYIFTDESLRPFIKGMQLFFAEEDRFRIKAHFGNIDEIQFSLQTFGIPTDASPQNKDGSWSLTWLHEWLAMQQKREEKALIPAEEQTKETNTEVNAIEDEDGAIEIPRRFDVILGKTAQARVHTGNRRAVHLCEMNYQKYEEANKFQKTEVAERIISIIRESGGRFIKWEASRGWVEEMDEIIARKKIGHFLRYIRSKRHSAQGDPTAVEDAAAAKKRDHPNQDPAHRRVTPPSSPGPILEDNDSFLASKILKI